MNERFFKVIQAPPLKGNSYEEFFINGSFDQIKYSVESTSYFLRQK